MSKDWVYDINNMHKKYKINSKIKLNKDYLNNLYIFRINFLKEELNELINSTSGADSVDALIDICVVAIGTLDLFQINAYNAWNIVLNANMNKTVGIKKTRPNPLNLPDLIKPINWKAPDHKNNIGLFEMIL